MELNLISLFNFNINFSQVSTTSFGEINVNLTFSILSFASVKKAGRGVASSSSIENNNV